MMFKIVLIATVALGLVAPAQAQAPTMDQRVQVLENLVRLQDDELAKLDQRLNSVEKDSNLALELALRSLNAKCFTETMALSRRPNGDLFRTTKDSQSRVYVTLVNRKCLSKTPRQGEDYRWRGFKP